jgi:imidazole glycerol-phosphate synthase subunit HisH
VITIVDYGLGNIKAFANIYKRLNMPCQIVSTVEDLSSATKIILPGVGAFDYAMMALQNSGMREMLDDLVLKKKVPVLGICVGMQMLANSSDEGALPGLGWIDGKVKKIDIDKLDDNEPLPHMGWNSLKQAFSCKLLDSLPQEALFYFLHSFYFECVNKKNIVATAHYGKEFGCVVQENNIYGMQCHPEKSHANGIKFLENFGSL